jgi:hypothetical protein
MIWRGYGVTVVPVVFASSLIANLVAILIGGRGYWETHGWPFAVSLGVAGIVLWVMDAFLAKRRPRILVDEATGERLEVGNRHEFLFICTGWWAVVLAGLAIWILLSGWSPGLRQIVVDRNCDPSYRQKHYALATGDGGLL